MEVTPRWVNLDYNNIVGLIRNPKGNVEGIKGERAKSSEQVYLVSQGFEQEGLAGENQAKLGKGRQKEGIFFTKTLTPARERAFAYLLNRALLSYLYPLSFSYIQSQFCFQLPMGEGLDV